MNRVFEAAIRRAADEQGARIDDAIPTVHFFGTVTAVTAGASPGGNARVVVRWRGNTIVVSSYAAAYTPAVGHRVKCALVENQVHIDGRALN